MQQVDWHFEDHYFAGFTHLGNIPDGKQLGKAFFKSAPSWVEGLMQFRNTLVKKLGLKTGEQEISDKQAFLEACAFQPGDRIGLFQVFSKGEHEVEFGEDDKHLNFRVILSANENGVTMKTKVHFHNRWGHLYFLPVKPFHRIISPLMLKRMVHGLESEGHGKLQKIL